MIRATLFATGGALLAFGVAIGSYDPFAGLSLVLAGSGTFIVLLAGGDDL